MTYKTSISLLALVAGMTAAPALAAAKDSAVVTSAPAEPAAAPPEGEPTKDTDIIVTGTRQTGMRAADSATPIQLIGAKAFESVGQQDLRQILAQNLPSLNFQSFGGDTANLTLSAALRGISPNDTMVLINGKRRHTTANLSVLGGSPYSGSATTDLSFVPIASMDHIEVLQDGAAAQYGSDAIAGVVNIILKNASHGGAISVTGGSNYSNGGDTAGVSANFGLPLGDKGFVNFTGEYRFHDYTQHGLYDRRYFNADGTLKAGNTAFQNAGIKASPFFPNVNTINGDARFSLYNVGFNAGYEIVPEVELYAFGNYGARTSKAYENYRNPERVSGLTTGGVRVYPLPLGFQPQESVREQDFSFTGGVRGTVSDWDYDLSLTYGRDAGALYTLDSANPSLFAQAQSVSATPLTGLQRDFYDGTLVNAEWVGNIDVKRDFDFGMAKPFTLAFGAEYRKNDYSISQGEYSSYAFGGGQSYPGFAPTDAGKFGRESYAGYVDVALDPVEGLHLDVAGRYEHYSDFGSVYIGKFTGRYDFSEAFAIRGTVSNGFRAPTLAESYYSSVNVGPGTTFGQLPPNSAAAQGLGFAPLKPEKSTNFSLGFVAHPASALQITVDAYQIRIKSRIVPSGNLFGSIGNPPTAAANVVSQAVLNALLARGVSLADATSYSGINIFTNGADTRTRGVEATLNYASDFGDVGKVDWSLGVNYNENKLLRIAALPASVVNVLKFQTSLLTPSAIDALTTATPKVKVIANALFTHGPFSLNLRETVYGSSSQRDSNDGSGNVTSANNGVSAQLVKIGTTFITDLNVSYNVTRAIRFDLGANNLFDKQAPTRPTLNGRPLSGNVYNSPVSFTPWGINGGYYYARATYKF